MRSLSFFRETMNGEHANTLLDFENVLKLELFLSMSLIEAHKTRWDWKTILNVPLNVPLNEPHKSTWRGLIYFQLDMKLRHTEVQDCYSFDRRDIWPPDFQPWASSHGLLTAKDIWPQTKVGTFDCGVNCPHLKFGHLTAGTIDRRW